MFILLVILPPLCALVFAFIVVGGLASGRLDGGMMALAGIFFAFLLAPWPFLAFWREGASNQEVTQQDARD